MAGSPYIMRTASPSRRMDISFVATSTTKSWEREKGYNQQDLLRITGRSWERAAFFFPYV